MHIGNPRVTVITATTGNKMFEQCAKSIDAQTYSNIQHLVFVDGEEARFKYSTLQDITKKNRDAIHLPYSVGKEQYNGHRMYAAGTYIAEGDYIMYLDEDNWLDAEHVEKLIKIATPSTWAFSFRKIVDSDGNFICNDDCESLGNWVSVINDYFVDVNCFFLPKTLALQLTPLWYRRARHPEDQPEVDRLLTSVLRSNKIEGVPSGHYSVNYRAGNRADSVQANFFLSGNEAMMKHYNGALPWKK